MARKSLTAETKRTVLDRFDNSCANCGEKETYLEIHHIVPLSRGGTDNIGNLVPLCWKCHQLAHSGYNIREKQKEILKTAGGRKRACSAEVYDEAFTKFLNGEIGKLKFCELTGYKYPLGSPLFAEALKKRGIVKMKNYLDSVISNIKKFGGIIPKEGRVVGYIEYTGGRREDIIYHGTAENNIGCASEGEIGKREQLPEEVFDIALKRFLNGEIGKTGFWKITGLNPSRKTCPQFRKAMEDRGILRIENNFDDVVFRGSPTNGNVVGYIDYIDGHREYIKYHSVTKSGEVYFCDNMVS